MLSSVAVFGGSKGMVAMPDLSGLSRDAAIAAVTSAGLVFSSSSNVDSTSGNNGKVVSQSVSSGTLVDYESSITFGVGLYTAPSGPVITFVTDTELDADGATVLKAYIVNDGAATCNSPGVAPFTQTQKRKRVYKTYKYIDGIKDPTFAAQESPASGPTPDPVVTNNVPDCGYSTPPSVTCTTSVSTISNGLCSNGYRIKTVMDINSCSDGTQSSGSPYNITEACCISLGTTYTNSTACNCYEKQADATTTTLCGSVTTSTTQRVTLTCVGGGCTGGT